MATDETRTFHQRQVAVRCRVCGRKRDQGRTHKSVSSIAFEIVSAFGVDVRQDDVDRHPTKVCTTCWNFIRKSCAYDGEGHAPQTSVVPQSEWPECSDGCPLCERWHAESTAGRPRKPTTTKRGRPPSSHSGDSKRKSSESSQSGETQEAPVELTVNVDAAIAGRVQAHTFELPLLPERVVGWEKGVKNEEIVCPVCQNLLERPLAVPVPGCEHAACWSCWEQWLPQSQTCPVCRSDVSAAELQPVARPVWQSLITTTLHCDFYTKGCQQTVTLANLRQHAEACQFRFRAVTTQPKAPEAEAQPGIPAVEPREKTVADLLAAPLDQEVSRDEQRLVTGILRRLSHSHQSSVGLPLQTGGRPVHVSFTPAASSTEQEGGVSDRTRRRRQDSLQKIERLMCGSDEAVQHQRAFHLARSTQAEREELLFQAKVHHYVSPAESLSMAVNLRLTNDQLRKLRLWTKRWNVYLAGERQARKFAEAQVGDVQIESEMVLATTSMSDGAAHDLSPSAFAWIQNLIALISQHLNSLEKRQLLTWHDQGDGLSLPKDEVWLKIGGDKGGGSFKMAFQIANQPCPNSADHTIVFACLEADDNVPNMHVALDAFKPVVSELQGMPWR